MANQEAVRNLFRAGYAAKGVVYGVIGLLGLFAALGVGGGETTGTSGALEKIASQPFGQLMLGIVALGLVGLVLWKFVQAFWDPDNAGTDAKGIAKRAGFFGSALLHGALCVAAISLITRGSSGGGNQKQEWSAWLLSQPGGAVLLALVGLGVIAFGGWQIYRAATRKYLEQYDTSRIPADKLRQVKTISDVGLSARGVTFGLIGGFVVIAAMQNDPGEVRGLGGSLQDLAEQPYGPWLLGIVSIGLVCYGIYCFFEAKFRDFPRVSLGGLPGAGAARGLATHR